MTTEKQRLLDLCVSIVVETEYQDSQLLALCTLKTPLGHEVLFTRTVEVNTMVASEIGKVPSEIEIEFLRATEQLLGKVARKVRDALESEINVMRYEL